MSLLPSSYDSSGEERKPRVVGVDGEDADEIFAALSSETARQLLTELHDEPAPPAKLADSVGTSIQNAQYHLGNLESAGAIEVIDTAYSEKGREMSVYAPADQPLVILAGDEEEESTLRAALSRLLGAVGALALASVVVQAIFGEELVPFGTGPGGGSTGGDGADGPRSEDAQTEDGAPGDTEDEVGDGAADGGEDVVEESQEVAKDAPDGAETIREELVDGAAAVVDAVANLPPGLIFFFAGLVVLAVAAGYLQYRNR